jgi:hypothetical protein
MSRCPAVVSTKPGATVFTRTPLSPTSFAAPCYRSSAPTDRLLCSSLNLSATRLSVRDRDCHATVTFSTDLGTSLSKDLWMSLV